MLFLNVDVIKVVSIISEEIYELQNLMLFIEASTFTKKNAFMIVYVENVCRQIMHIFNSLSVY